MAKSFLLIDTSYLIFFRFHALKVWFSKAKPEVSLDTEDITTVPEFMEKYESTFLQTVEKISKKEGFTLSNTIFIRDCSGSDIWRKDHYPEYKGTRDYSKFNGNKLFKWTYETLLPKYVEKGATVLRFDRLEADDTAAILVKSIREHSTDKIVIITSDNDYLQLLSYPSVKLINLKGDSLGEKSIGSPYGDLMKKIILGDPSDNLPKVFKRCGIKTLQKYLDDKTLLEKALESDKEAKSRYDLNQLLIDFNNIPSDYAKPVHDWFTSKHMCTF
jgi:5'-3' exonuclease